MKPSANTSQNSEERGVLEQYMLPYLNVSSQFPLYPGKNSAITEAALLGWTEQELEQARANLQENARQAALELLKEDDIVDQLDALPFDGAGTGAIAGFGFGLFDTFALADRSTALAFMQPATYEIPVQDNGLWQLKQQPGIDFVRFSVNF